MPWKTTTPICTRLRATYASSTTCAWLATRPWLRLCWLQYWRWLCWLWKSTWPFCIPIFMSVWFRIGSRCAICVYCLCGLFRYFSAFCLWWAGMNTNTRLIGKILDKKKRFGKKDNFWPIPFYLNTSFLRRTMKTSVPPLKHANKIFFFKDLYRYSSLIWHYLSREYFWIWQLDMAHIICQNQFLIVYTIVLKYKWISPNLAFNGGTKVREITSPKIRYLVSKS